MVENEIGEGEGEGRREEEEERRERGKKEEGGKRKGGGDRRGAWVEKKEQAAVGWCAVDKISINEWPTPSRDGDVDAQVYTKLNN